MASCGHLNYSEQIISSLDRLDAAIYECFPPWIINLAQEKKSWFCGFRYLTDPIGSVGSNLDLFRAVFAHKAWREA